MKMKKTMAFRKSRRAMSKDDYETWIESETTNTINAFDGGGEKRATTVVVMVGYGTEDTNREKIF